MRPAAIVDTVALALAPKSQTPRVHGSALGENRGGEGRCELVLQVARLGRGLRFVVTDERGPGAISDPLRVQRPRGTA